MTVVPMTPIMPWVTPLATPAPFVLVDATIVDLDIGHGGTTLGPASNGSKKMVLSAQLPSTRGMHHLRSNIEQRYRRPADCWPRASPCALQVWTPAGQPFRTCQSNAGGDHRQGHLQPP